MLFAVILVLGSALESSAPSNTAELDFDKYPCRVYSERLKEAVAPDQIAAVDDLHLWLLGYASAKNGRATLSRDISRSFRVKLGEKCQANPDISVAKAAVLSLSEYR